MNPHGWQGLKNEHESWYATASTRPHWLTDAEPITREELLEWLATRIGVLVTDGYITFMPIGGEANLLYWLERDFLTIPTDSIYDGAKTYYVYRSTYEYDEEV